MVGESPPRVGEGRLIPLPSRRAAPPGCATCGGSWPAPAAQVTAKKHHSDADQHDCEGQVAPDEGCLGGQDDYGDADENHADPPSRLAGAHPALDDRLGLPLAGYQQPARHVQEDAQSSDEAQQGEGDPDYPGGHTQVEGQPGRYPS